VIFLGLVVNILFIRLLFLHVLGQILEEWHKIDDVFTSVVILKIMLYFSFVISQRIGHVLFIWSI
jgi:hypothetical protein